jgi:hypothetical protein
LFPKTNGTNGPSIRDRDFGAIYELKHRTAARIRDEDRIASSQLRPGGGPLRRNNYRNEREEAAKRSRFS